MGENAGKTMWHKKVFEVLAKLSMLENSNILVNGKEKHKYLKKMCQYMYANMHAYANICKKYACSIY